MFDIFKKSNKIIENLNKPTKEYWENDSINWDKEAKAPDGSLYNEQSLFESIREADKKRLLRFG